MSKITFLLAMAAALLACGLSAAPAEAGPNRTFVSGKGTDAGACTRAAPCRFFAFAIGQTNAGGVIVVLDPAGYGAVTIAKAISIVNDGVGTAGITAGSGIAITIKASPSDSVHLRGLSIAGLGTGSNGILFNSGGNLAIENCVVRGFVTAGVNISPSTPSSFSVSNTISSNNGVTSEGILVEPTGAAVTGVLSEVTANNNRDGILVAGFGVSVNVTIADSEASNNSSGGVVANSSATAIMLRNSVVSNNGAGLSAAGTAVLRVAHSVVTGNFNGVTMFGGTIFSYGDNDIDGNTNNNYGALTPIPTH